MMPHLTLHLLNAFLLAVVLIHALNPIAMRIGLLDRPSSRKAHDRTVPATGGLAMFGGFLIAAVQLDSPLAMQWNLAAGLALLVALGVVDDLISLGPWPKLAGQAGAVLVMVLPGRLLFGPNDLLGLGPADASLLIDASVTALFVVGIINAFNMLDGLDGLAGGVAAAALTWIAVAAALSGTTGTLAHALLLLTAVLGFLTFNARHPWRRRAAVFMGDAGSMMLGAAVAFFLLDLSTGPTRSPILPALLWLVALPVFDTVVLIARRSAAGQSPLRGDRRHVHHFLLRAGLSPQAATSLLVAVCFFYGGVGVIGGYSNIPNWMMLAGLLVPFAAHLYFVLQGWRVIEHARAIRGAQQPAAGDPIPRPISQPEPGFP